MPKALLDKPEVPGHLTFYWQAFQELLTDRPLGALGGAGAIPWTSLDRYAARFGIDCPDAFQRFAALIRAMEAAYHEEEAARRPREDKGKP